MAGKLTFLANHSKFKPYQKLKIQETPDQLVNGRVPRVFWIELRGNLIRLAVPGDVIMVQGVLLPERRIGARQADDLMFDLYL